MRVIDPGEAYGLADAEDQRREAQAHAERLQEAAGTLYRLGGLQALRDELGGLRADLHPSWAATLTAELEARS